MQPFGFVLKRMIHAIFSILICSSICFSPPGAAAQQSKTDAGSAAPQSGTGTDAAKVNDAAPQTTLGKTVAKAPPPVLEDPKKKGIEDWDALAAPKEFVKYLPDSDPDSVLGVADYGDFTHELVEAEWRQGDPIDLHILKPKGVAKPPVILYLFSYPSTTARYQNIEYERFLTRSGVAAVGFVSALTGQRYHDIPQKKWFVSELQQTLVATTHDVQLILDYLEKRGDFDMTRVGIFGDGSGATIAILAAAADPRIKAIDLLNPWGDWPDWVAQTSLIRDKERADYQNPEFLKKVENFDPVKWLPELKGRQVRLQYVLKGVSVTPPTAMERVEAAAPPNVTIIHYDTAKEFLKNVGFQGTGFDWIKQQLGATIKVPAEAQATAASQTSPAAKTP